jgi:predicted nucleic acid binding AN1-type Zn finger protein
MTIVEKSNRCAHSACSKSLGILPFHCRCSLEFCVKHRMPENHQCTFDFKTFEKEILEKQNKGLKIEKIEKL